MEIDGGKDIGHFRSSNIELGQQFHLAARDAGIDMQLSRDVYEILCQRKSTLSVRIRTRVGTGLCPVQAGQSPASTCPYACCDSLAAAVG